MNTLFPLLMLVILRLALRKTWLAVAVWFVLAIGVFWPAYGSPVTGAILTLMMCAVYVVLLFRFGFLSVAVGVAVWHILKGLPITPDVSSWMFGGTLVALAIVLGLAIYGLRTALAGRPVFRDEFAVATPTGTKV
jgi:hypothetical protein